MFKGKSSLFLLIFQFHLVPARHEFGIIRKILELPEFIQVGNPTVTNLFRDQSRQPWITQHYPASGCNTIGFVAEFLGRQFIEIMQ